MTAITAIGTANPAHRQYQDDIARFIALRSELTAVEKRRLNAIFKSAGIQERYSVIADYGLEPEAFNFFPQEVEQAFPSTAERMRIYREHALPLALQAIQNCIANAKEDALSDITHIITVSCTGMYAPGLDVEIVQRLSLSSSTRRTAIQFMGCYGAFNAIKVADAICQAEAKATVLIVCVELCSLHYQKSGNLDVIIANAIFADGAAAVILKKQPDLQSYLSLTHFHSDIIAQTGNEMTWQIGNQGFDIVLSTYVPTIIESGIAQFVERLCEQSDIDVNNIDLYAIHPGGIKILEACEKALNITKLQNQYAYEILKHYGNMSSATVLFVLKALWQQLTRQDHHKTIFSCAFGPGLTLESMLLKVHYQE